MFDHIFENRDKKVTNIVKLSDYLGRSLRENVEVFSIDDTEEKVTFVTESGKIIAGTYNFDNGIKLHNVQVEDGELFENSENFDEFVNYKISNFVQNIFEEDFAEADTSFSKVLQLWESRVKFSSVKKKLYEKSQKFSGASRIIESSEFQRLVEIAPQLVEFLGENRELVNIPEIKNMIKLSSSVATAFNIPKLTTEQLAEQSYEISEEVNHTVYDMICKQELIRKELVESKNNFDLVWLNNTKISALAGLIYERDEEAIAKALVEAVCEVPYLALATKRQIMETLTNNLELNDAVKVNMKDIKSFSSLLFEYKKPLKNLFVSMLNEKYGISVQNLKDIPTFKSLLNTQVLIFEALAKLSPKGSIVKETLSEASKMLKTKNGVESIDVNHFIELLFEKAGYNDILSDETLVEKISIKETFSEMDSIEELVDVILNTVQEADAPKEASPEPEHLASIRRANRAADELTAKKALEKENKKKEVDAARKKRQDSETDLGDDPKVEEAEKEIADEAPISQEDENVAEKEENLEPDDERKDEEGETKEVPTSDEIMSSFKSFEDILNSIDFDEIVGNEEEAEEPEEVEDAEVNTEEEEEQE